MTPMYTPTEDKEIVDDRGVTRQVAVKGVPMALSDAVRYGLVSADEARKIGGTHFNAGPSEVKDGVLNASGEGGTAAQPQASTVTSSARRTTTARRGKK